MRSSAVRRLSSIGAVAAMVICCAVLRGDRRATGADLAGSPAKTTANPNQRQREGAAISDMLGHFKMTGDRATFYPSDGSSGLAGLENLNLERITLVISENPDQLLWSVSGTITEFRGANYILVSKAVLRSKTDSSEPGGSRAGAFSKPNERGASRSGRNLRSQ